ncbi:MAG: NFACT family protein [Treponema sp.]|jgi:predicted ribosome quality control (RQC) complex YloA/Tae2 family protein|nr:NFACT family protein [Treponema sp.]
MSLNWKEINLVLDELALPGLQIQKVTQSAYGVLCLSLYGRSRGKTLLICAAPGACRLHETFQAAPKSEKPLRFAEFLNAHLVNAWIEEAAQLGDNRVVRITARRGEKRYRLYCRLWSNAANVIVTDEGGRIMDALFRRPKRGEVTGGRYAPEEALDAALDTAPAGRGPPRDYAARDFAGVPGASYNAKVDAFYAASGNALSLEALREEARRRFEARLNRIGAALERLRQKEAAYADADRWRAYGDIILANASSVKPGDAWLEAEDFYETNAGGARTILHIELDPPGKAAAAAESWYEKYRKAKKGLGEVREELSRGEEEARGLRERLAALLAETNPLVLNKLLRQEGRGGAAKKGDAGGRRPGLSFRRGDWLLMVGRDAAENDALLRHCVRGNDLWLHTRDTPGGYVFVRHRAGKTVPLEVLLDAGNLAVFYSKARNAREADLFYTQVKYLRRAKGGPKGLVIPTQEKNLHITLDEKRLRALEDSSL